MTALLHAEGLTVFRGERCLFHKLSFAVRAGEALLVQGANGSGKTSLLRTLAGLSDLEEGEVRWRDMPIRGARQAYHRELAWFAHRAGCKNDLTLLENLQVEVGLRGVSLERLTEVLERLKIAQCRRLPFRALSAGQQRRVALARLLLARAPLWMLDEPLTNLDRDGQALVTDIVTEHLQAGGLCVLASHQAVALDAPQQRLELA